TIGRGWPSGFATWSSWLATWLRMTSTCSRSPTPQSRRSRWWSPARRGRAVTPATRGPRSPDRDPEQHAGAGAGRRLDRHPFVDGVEPLGKRQEAEPGGIVEHGGHVEADAIVGYLARQLSELLVDL